MLPQYWVPARVGGTISRLRGKPPGLFARSADRVARDSRPTIDELVLAGPLASITWLGIGFGCLPTAIIVSIVIGRRLPAGSVLRAIVDNAFMCGLCFAFAIVVMVNFRVRSAARDRARGESEATPMSRPKGWDLLIALAIAAGGAAFGSASVGGIS